MRSLCAVVAACCAAFAYSAEERNPRRINDYPIAREIICNINERLEGKDPDKALWRYADYASNGRRGLFVENPDFWAKGIDFSCASPWNSQEGQYRAGTAVSARHVVFADHYPIWHGTEIIFVGNDGEIVRRRMIRGMRVCSSDLMVGLLDADLPQTIKPAYVMPESYTNHIGYGNGLPTVVFDQEEKALVVAIRSVTRGKTVGQTLPRPNEATWSRFYETVECGDSGNPAFLAVRGGVILLATVQCKTGIGPSVFAWRREIQQVMDSLAPGYRLREYDFAMRYGDQP